MEEGPLLQVSPPPCLLPPTLPDPVTRCFALCRHNAGVRVVLLRSPDEKGLEKAGRCLQSGPEYNPLSSTVAKDRPEGHLQRKQNLSGADKTTGSDASDESPAEAGGGAAEQPSAGSAEQTGDPVVGPGTSLKRELGLLSVFSIAAGAMISSGLFVLPGLAFANAGPAVILSYGLASALILPVMFSKAELSTAMPRAGGSYFYIERSMGPLAGTVAGLANWLSIALKGAFALVGLGALAAEALRVVLSTYGVEGFEGWFQPDREIWLIRMVALTACVFFTVLNLVSAKHAGRLQGVMVLGLLVIVTTYVTSGIGKVHALSYSPFASKGWQAVFSTAGMVFISYGGLTKVVSVSEEVKDPARTLPRGMFLAFGVVSILYMLVVFVTVGLVKPEALSGSLVPISQGAAVAIGKWGAVIVGLGALLAFSTTANSGILSASRSPMAMSRDGLLPKALSRTNHRFGTPHLSILITTLFIAAVVAFLSLEDLVKTASTMMILMFTLVNVSVIIMRQSGIQNYRPTFRAPLYPWLQIGAVLVYGFLIFEMGRIPLILTGMFTLLALIWYLAYVMPRIERKGALVYLVKSIVSSEIAQRDLEEELKKITIERDDISHDRLDQLVKQAPVLDLDSQMSAPEMFSRVSEILAPRVGIDRQKLYDRFLEREMESSTVIRPGLAIPHIIVEGENIFDMALVRSLDGVVFSDLNPPVTTAFVLVGSKDERNFHLKALMSIAQIVEEKDFQKRWEKARGEEELRDLVLLSSRRRET